MAKEISDSDIKKAVERLLKDRAVKKEKKQETKKEKNKIDEIEKKSIGKKQKATFSDDFSSEGGLDFSAIIPVSRAEAPILKSSSIEITNLQESNLEDEVKRLDGFVPRRTEREGRGTGREAREQEQAKYDFREYTESKEMREGVSINELSKRGFFVQHKAIHEQLARPHLEARPDLQDIEKDSLPTDLTKYVETPRDMTEFWKKDDLISHRPDLKKYKRKNF